MSRRACLCYCNLCQFLAKIQLCGFLLPNTVYAVCSVHIGPVIVQWKQYKTAYTVKKRRCNYCSLSALPGLFIACLCFSQSLPSTTSMPTIAYHYHCQPYHTKPCRSIQCKKRNDTSKCRANALSQYTIHIKFKYSYFVIFLK